MTLQQAKIILKDYITPSGVLSNSLNYTNMFDIFDKEITLDGSYSLELLEAMVIWWKYKLDANTAIISLPKPNKTRRIR